MEELPQVINKADDADPSTLSSIIDGIGAFLGHVPISIKRNVEKAFNHLMKVPNAYIDGWADEVRANSDARVQITKATGKALAKAVSVDSTLAEIATHTHANKILRQQKNVVKVLQQAAEELRESPIKEQDQQAEMSEDWLNAFESEAVHMSSESMQRLFGKMLAGEIRNPTSYSIRTIKLIAQLDNDVAKHFQKLCSITCSFRLNNRVVDANALTFGLEHIAALHDFDLPFSAVRALVEYGLVVSSSPYAMPYEMAVLRKESKFKLPFIYNNRKYVLVPIPLENGKNYDLYGELSLNLSRAGKELLSIVEVEEDPAYTTALTAYFKKQGLQLHSLEPMDEN